MAGITSSFGAGGHDAWLIKTDAAGGTTWSRTIGGARYDCARSVAQTADGGYIIAGETNSFGAGEYDAWLIKTDGSGDTLWTRTFGGTGRDEGHSVQQTWDGGYVIAGLTCSSSPDFHSDVYLVRIDACGDTVWTRDWGREDDDEGYSVAHTADGGCVLTGHTDLGLWFIKTDADGDTAWTRTYGDMDMDCGYSVAHTADGGYIIAGESYDVSLGNVCLAKVDASGDTIWARTWGGVDWDGGRSVAQTTDGGYIIVGSTRSYGAGETDVWLIKTDSDGDTLWTRTFGGADYDFGWSVAQTADGGYVIAGSTESFGAGRADALLIKTDETGRVAIAEPAAGPCAGRSEAGATVVRGTLSLQLTAGGSRQELLNAAGRKVMDLAPGENDVSRLAPGVHFVQSTSDNRPSYIARVVIAR